MMICAASILHGKLLSRLGGVHRGAESSEFYARLYGMIMS